MRQKLLRAFWDCGDNEIIEFAILRARLNKKEKYVLLAMLDECLTQEEVAEQMHYSPRYIQCIWYSGADKLLGIPWVYAYALELSNKKPPFN